MKLYEPFATWLLIVLLTLAFSGELFDVFLTEHEKECHRRNATILQDQKQGPIQEC
jgi:hypothetical protein